MMGVQLSVPVGTIQPRGEGVSPLNRIRGAESPEVAMKADWMNVVRVGTVAALVGAAGMLGGFDQPKDSKDKPAAKEPEKAKGQEKKEEHKPVEAAKHEFKIEEGTYAEACSCHPPCPC